jgi:hypothetical protein
VNTPRPRPGRAYGPRPRSRVLRFERRDANSGKHEPYNFDHAFERTLVVELATNQKLWPCLGRYLDPTALGQAETRVVVEALRVLTLDDAPAPSSETAVLQYLARRQDEGKLTYDARTQVIDMFAEQASVTAPTDDEIIAQVKPVLQRRLYKEVARIAVEELKPCGDMSRVSDLIEIAHSIGNSDAAPSHWLTLGERARAICSSGQTPRLMSGLPTLDSHSHGGRSAPSIMTVCGPPGAGKTQLVARLAWQWARTGVPVVYCAVDGGAHDVMVRLGTFAGFDRTRLEDGDAGEWALAANALSLLSFDVSDEATLEDSIARLDAKAGGGLGVLVIDSVQALAKALHPDLPPREAVDALLVRVRELRATRKWLVPMTSEVSRAHYGNKKTAGDASAMAAGKESGSIEYGVDTQLVLTSVEGGQGGLVDVAVPKNRPYGRGPSFRVLMAPDGEVREVARETASDTQDATGRNLKVEEHVREVLAAIPCRSRRASYEAAKERGIKVRAGDWYAAVRSLVDRGDLTDDESGLRLAVESASRVEVES